jgi:hypothetical protein
MDIPESPLRAASYQPITLPQSLIEIISSCEDSKASWPRLNVRMGSKAAVGRPLRCVSS